MNRPYGWDGPNPYAAHDRAEQERIAEWEAAVQAEAREGRQYDEREERP